MKWMRVSLCCLFLVATLGYADNVYIKQNADGTVSFSDRKDTGSVEDALVPGMPLNELLKRVDAKKQKAKAEAAAKAAKPEVQASTPVPKTEAVAPVPTLKAPAPETKNPVAATKPGDVEPAKKKPAEATPKEGAKTVKLPTYTKFTIIPNTKTNNVFSQPDATGMTISAFLEPALAAGDIIKVYYDGKFFISTASPTVVDLNAIFTKQESYNKLVKERPLKAEIKTVPELKDKKEIGTKVILTLDQKSVTMINVTRGKHTWEFKVFRGGKDIINTKSMTINVLYAELKKALQKASITYSVVRTIVNVAKNALTPV